EVIQVDQHQAGIARRLLAVLQAPFGFVDEMLPIEDAGKPVAPRELHEAQLRTLDPIGPARSKPIPATAARYTTGWLPLPCDPALPAARESGSSCPTPRSAAFSPVPSVRLSDRRVLLH